jgi:SAM-dependent methyltransferase
VRAVAREIFVEMHESSLNDEVRTFWDERPCNVRHSDKEIGTREYFEEVTRRKYFVESHIPAFARFEAYKDKAVLEVGCGIGTAAQSFMEAGAKYTGIDISPRSVDIARQRARVFALDGKFLVADVQMNNFVDGSFDLVYSFGVLHHIPNLNDALRNIRNVLKPGGEFKLMMYAENSWKKMCIDSGLDQYEAQSGVPIAETFTREEITRILSPYFIDVCVEQDHIFQWNVSEYKAYRYEKEAWFTSMPEPLIRALEKRFGWHLLITCRKPATE